MTDYIMLNKKRGVVRNAIIIAFRSNGVKVELLFYELIALNRKSYIQF